MAVEFGGGPDHPYLASPVLGGIVDSKTGLLPVFEVELDILKKRRLVAFDGEVVVALASYDVGGDFPLCEKGIGCYVLALDVDGIKERSSHLDLVCLFELSAGSYG